MQTAETLAGLLIRELRALRRELEAYPDDASIWARPDGVANSAGALTHHLAGNIRHFVGARLGGGSYLRDRAAEFGRLDLPRAELIAMVEAAAADVGAALPLLDDAALAREFPDGVANHRLGTGELLLHLLSHFSYHLGQIDYHRRIVTGSPATVNVASIAEVPGARPEV
jgi:uncharacterized damage-inducible protein DinB